MSERPWFTWEDVDRHKALAERVYSRWRLRRERAEREHATGGDIYTTPEALAEADAIEQERVWHENMASIIAASLPPREVLACVSETERGGYA